MTGVDDEIKLLFRNGWKNVDSTVCDVNASFQVPVLDWKNDEVQRQKVVLEFYKNHLLRNMPCLISETATLNWKSRKEWVSEELKPNFGYLKTHFGEATVPVADCDAKEYNAQKKENMSLMDYLTYWEDVINGGYDYGKHGMLYLKDWHFMRDFPLYKAYEILECFSSDWLNEFWCQRTDAQDDYQFVYMGPKGSWTPLHTDVFHSYSWSANICGVKKWILYPPVEEDNLKDYTGQLAYDVMSPAMQDSKVFPRFHKICHRYEVEQKPGQIIFVPSRWFHQVFNMDNTISINHNWFNGFNIHIIWESLMTMNKAVEKEIEDCQTLDDWNAQCQVILKATHGMDFKEFYELIHTVAERRLCKLKKEGSSTNNSCEDVQDVFDLCKIYRILQHMKLEPVVLKSIDISTEFLNLLHDAIQHFDG